MARKKHQPTAPPDARLHTALHQYADVLEAAPREDRRWLERTVKLTCLGSTGVIHQAAALESSALLERIRTRGVVHGVVEYLAVDVRQRSFWQACGARPSWPRLFALVREVLVDPDAAWRAVTRRARRVPRSFANGFAVESASDRPLSLSLGWQGFCGRVSSSESKTWRRRNSRDSLIGRRR
jgi:hypothetical protein